MDEKLQDFIAEVIVSQQLSLRNDNAGKAFICDSLTTSILHQICMKLFERIAQFNIEAKYNLKRALVVYFTATKQFYSLCSIVEIAMKNGEKDTDKKYHQLKTVIASNYNEVRRSLQTLVENASVDIATAQNFRKFAESIVGTESRSEIDKLITDSVLEKAKMLNVEKNLQDNAFIKEAGASLDREAFASVIHREYTKILFDNAVDMAKLMTVENFTPAYLSFGWACGHLDDPKMKGVFLKFIRSITRGSNIHEDDVLFSITSRGHGACVGVVKPSAKRKYGIVFILFTGSDNAKDWTVSNVDGSMAFQQARYAEIDRYLTDNLYSQGVGKDQVDFIIGGYILGGAFAQLTATQLQDQAHSVIAVTLDTPALWKRMNMPPYNPKKAMILNFQNSNDNDIIQAKLEKLSTLGIDIPYNGKLHGEVADKSVFRWIMDMDFAQHRFVDPRVKVSYADTGKTCGFCGLF